jgi:uncharacterized protein (DUF433 family)
METIQALNLIATSPYTRSGRPYIIGTTVTVADVVMARLYHNQDAEGIAQWYNLALPQVYAALAYYYEHKDEIDAQIRDQVQRAKTLKEQRLGSQDSLLH